MRQNMSLFSCHFQLVPPLKFKKFTNFGGIFCPERVLKHNPCKRISFNSCSWQQHERNQKGPTWKLLQNSCFDSDVHLSSNWDRCRVDGFGCEGVKTEDRQVVGKTWLNVRWNLSKLVSYGHLRVTCMLTV